MTYSIITISEEGIALYDDKIAHLLRQKAKVVFDVTGAGDYGASYTWLHASKRGRYKRGDKDSKPRSSRRVAKIGSATASFSEIEPAAKIAHLEANFEHKLKSIEELEEILSQKGKEKVSFHKWLL